MAIECVIWVLNHSRSKLAARLVLIAIADNANRDGTGAWPSVKEISRKANVSPSSVRKTLRDLTDLGELEVVYNGGKPGPNGVTNLYRVVMLDYPEEVTDRNVPRPHTPSESAPLQDLDPSKSWTPADSAPPPDSGPLQDSALGPQNLRFGPSDSGGGTVLEPSLNRPKSGRRSATPAAAPDLFGGTVTPIRPGRADCQVIVKAWVDWCDARSGVKPPPRTIGAIAKNLALLADAGYPDPLLRRALAAWQDKGLDPSKLSDVLNEVANSQRGADGRRPGAGAPGTGQSALPAPVAGGKRRRIQA